MVHVSFYAFLSTIYLRYCLAVPLGAYNGMDEKIPRRSASLEAGTLVLPTLAEPTIHVPTARIPTIQKRHTPWNETAISCNSAQSAVDFVAVHIGIITMGGVGGFLALVSILCLVRFYYEQIVAKGNRSPGLSPWLDRVYSARNSLATRRNISPWRWTATPGTNQTYEPLLQAPNQLEGWREYSRQERADPERIVLKRSSVNSQVIGLGISVDRRQLEEHLKRLNKSQPSNQPRRKSVRFETQPSGLACLHNIAIPRTPSVQTWAQFARSGFT